MCSSELLNSLHPWRGEQSFLGVFICEAQFRRQLLRCAFSWKPSQKQSQTIPSLHHPHHLLSKCHLSLLKLHYLVSSWLNLCCFNCCSCNVRDLILVTRMSLVLWMGGIYKHYMKEWMDKSWSFAHYSLTVNSGRSSSRWLDIKCDIVSPGIFPLMPLAEMKPSSGFMYKIKG